MATMKNVTPKSVSTTDALAKNVDMILNHPDEISLLKAEAQKVFDALGKQSNVKYDLYEGKTEAGETYLRGSLQISAFGPKENKDAKFSPSNLISLEVALADEKYTATKGDNAGQEVEIKKGEIKRVNVFKYDTSKVNPKTGKGSMVELKKPSEQLEATLEIRKTLENAGLVKPFLTIPYEKPEGSVEKTPAGELRSKMYDAIQKANEGKKAKNSKGEEVGEYYATPVTNGKFKDGTAFESFSICNHNRQQADFLLVGNEVASVTFKDFNGYDKDKKNAEQIGKYTCYNADVLEARLTGEGKADNAGQYFLPNLDAGIKEIVSSVAKELTFRPYTKGDKGNDSVEMEQQFPDMDER